MKVDEVLSMLQYFKEKSSGNNDLEVICVSINELSIFFVEERINQRCTGKTLSVSPRKSNKICQQLQVVSMSARNRLIKRSRLGLKGLGFARK